MLLPNRQTFCGRWLTRRLTPTGSSHLLLFIDTSAINTKLPKAVNTAEGSLWYGGGMLGGYLPRAPPPRLIPWCVCPWVPIYLLLAPSLLSTHHRVLGQKSGSSFGHFFVVKTSMEADKNSLNWDSWPHYSMSSFIQLLGIGDDLLH